MIRDLTMIVAVLASVASVGFGVYKNIEAGNAKGFAYEQAYRILNVVQNSDTLTPFQRASITDAALGVISTPEPVIDLSRSSADVGEPTACTPGKVSACTDLAESLAQANRACAKNVVGACTQAQELQREVVTEACIACFTNN
jgi:hypothetical protein